MNDEFAQVMQFADDIDRVKAMGLVPNLICLPGQHRLEMDGTDMAATLSGNLPVGWESVAADMIENDEWLVPRVKYNPVSQMHVPVCPRHIDCFKRGESCVE